MADPTGKPDGPSLDSAKKPGKGCGCGCSSGCLAVLAVLAVLVGLAVMLVPLVARYYVRSDLSPSEIQELDDLRHKPINFPREWAEVTPFSDELKAQQRRAMEAAEALPTTATMHFTDHNSSVAQFLLEYLYDIPLSAADAQTSLTQLAQSGTGYIQEIVELVSLPGYDADALSDNFTSELMGWDILDHYEFHDGRWFIVAMVSERLEAGDCVTAADLALVPLRAAVSHPVTAGDLELASCVIMSAHLSHKVAMRCENASILQSMLSEMNRTEADIPWVLDNQLEPIAGELSKLRRYKRDGYPVDIQTGKPGMYYQWANIEAEAGLFAEHMVKTLPLDDPQRKRYVEMVDECTEEIGRFGIVRLIYIFRAMQLLAPDMMVAMMLDEQTRPSTIKQKRLYYDLARLNIARRLARLEGDATTTESRSLVPDYLPEDPLCPYTEKPYLWDEETHQYYSAGPDGNDEGLKATIDRGLTYSDLAIGDLAISTTHTLTEQPYLRWY